MLSLPHHLKAEPSRIKSIVSCVLVAPLFIACSLTDKFSIVSRCNSCLCACVRPTRLLATYHGNGDGPRSICPPQVSWFLAPAPYNGWWYQNPLCFLFQIVVCALCRIVLTCVPSPFVAADTAAARAWRQGPSSGQSWCAGVSCTYHQRRPTTAWLSWAN